jgi:DNA mismatch repair protein MutL
MLTLALAHPEAGFEFHADQVCRFHVPAGQALADRLRALWGRELADTLVPLAFASGAFRVEGFVQRPADARPTGRRTQLFVNGRPFRDNFLVRAAEAGYRSAIAPGDRPSLVLLLTVRPDEVDVNVHPAKLEVRFRDRIGLERTIEDAVRHALGDLVAAAPLGTSVGALPRPVPPIAGDAPAAGVTDLFAPAEGGVPDEGAGVAGGDPLAGVPLMQVFDTYLVYPASDGVVIVDQHSAHERVLFEAAMRELTGVGAAAQRLLVPEPVELTDEELEAVEAHDEALRRVGFEAEAFGGRAVVLHAVPTPHPRFDAIACFREMVADLARGRFGGWANRLERFAATYACRAAVKAGDRLSEREMRALLARLFLCELPPHDVHGRSTIVQLPRDELERRFGRR